VPFNESSGKVKGYVLLRCLTRCEKGAAMALNYCRLQLTLKSLKGAAIADNSFVKLYRYSLPAG
jgi:hypothetical protein